MGVWGPLPGREVALGLYLPQRVVFWSDLLRAAEHLPDDPPLLAQSHKTVPVRHHGNYGRIDKLDIQQPTWGGGERERGRVRESEREREGDGEG